MCIFAVVMKNNAMKKEKDGALINSVESEQSRSKTKILNLSVTRH